MLDVALSTPVDTAEHAEAAMNDWDIFGLQILVKLDGSTGRMLSRRPEDAHREHWLGKEMIYRMLKRSRRPRRGNARDKVLTMFQLMEAESQRKERLLQAHFTMSSTRLSEPNPHPKTKTKVPPSDKE